MWTCLFVVLATLPAREFPPAVPPPKPVVLPTPAVRLFPNGLKVVLIERHSLPLVTLRLVVKAGAEADPPGLPGTAQLVATLLDQGTSRRSARQIAEAVDFVGGMIETGAGWDKSFAAVKVPSDHTELAFDLISDIFIRPIFAPSEVERQRKQTLSALEVVRDDPSYIADAAIRRLIFGETAYGHPADGTAEAVRRVTVENLRAFHAQHYRPSNSILMVVGDISAEEAFRGVEKYFGDWKGGPRFPSPPVTLPAPGTRQVVVIDKPDAVQTEIRIGNFGPRRESPDYYALIVANQVLGGPAANRLFKALRSQQGLTYGASSDLVCHLNLGSWVAKTFTRTSETVKSVQLALEQMKRLRDDSISPSELETAKSYLTGHLALEFEASEGIASEVLELLIYNLPLDYWNRFPDHLRALTPEDVLSATRRYLDHERNVIVLVGNAVGFRKELKKLGPSRVIPLPRLDLASRSLERGSVAVGDP